MERRFSAVLAADVAGYSRLMHDDEEATHIRLTEILAGAIYPSIEEHGGRVVKYTGDGFLAEFSCAIEAMRAALQFQNHFQSVTRKTSASVSAWASISATSLLNRMMYLGTW